MNLDIEERVAVVTGAAGGIGAATAKRLAQEGVAVLLVDLDEAGLAARVSEITGFGGRAAWAIADVTNAADVEAMVAKAHMTFGGVHILVNNAGFTRDKRITAMDERDWDSVVDVVLKGAFLCTRAAIPLMAEAQWGRIINMSSRAHLGNAGQANYSAAKAGLLGFTRAMALENGRNNITVNAVAPGIIATPAVTGLPHYEKIREAAEKITPIRRLGEVEDIADAVAFLASNRASYITGEVLHVTGGRY